MTKESGQAAPEGIVLAFNRSGGEEGVKEIFDNHEYQSTDSKVPIRTIPNLYRMD